MTLSKTLATLTADNGLYRACPGDDWRQGRTLYGGIQAALAVEAVQRAYPDLPPLRSAQIAYVGPSAGEIEITPTLLRAGKSSAFISVGVTAEAGAAAQLLLCFGAARDSAHRYTELPMPKVEAPDAYEPFFQPPVAPVFTQHLDSRRAGGATVVTGAKRPELLLWLRHRDDAAPDGPASLLALGDAPPPAAMTMFTDRAPISTMTWSVDVLADSFDGGAWHLLHVVGDTVADGYSSQTMTMWTADGRPVMAARQTVAIYA
ncbi:acyl-CoA thioesterase [Sphingoaurantiacus capsulatus]|uniref:Acyl-CoA thioesterase n=1 Tax=Sphingoaurantiacus capsulatus TaxID=1771310 RepID=A0ABV7X8Y8_9SPHN